MIDYAALKADLDGLRIEDNPAIVKQKSRDFFWYSPVLKRQLDDVSGDLVVTVESLDQIVRVLKACHARDVPVTVRGAGTGNYGQAMPLSGGVILNLAEMDAVRQIKTGSVVAEAGAILYDIDVETRRHSGQELRMHPSTYRTATIGGFIAGGYGGVGSIRWGSLRDSGNVVRVKVVTMEAEPRILDLRGDDIARVLHAYGTNGVITEVEMPLTSACKWVDVLVAFDDFMDAARFGDELGRQDGLLTKEIAPIAAPLPFDYFLRHKKFVRQDQSVCVCMVADFAMAAFQDMAGRSKGTIVYRADKATSEELNLLPPAYELTWNHTTLRGLRVDPSITYLQVLYPYPDHLERVRHMTDLLGDEAPGHLEFVRVDGAVTCYGLPVIRYSNEARLNEIIRLHEDNGCKVFNPHRYTLEEGGMKRTDQAQLDFKRRADPKGLLNPGKMVGWEDPQHDPSHQDGYLVSRMRQTG